MATILDKAVKILREDGPITLTKKSIRFGYDTWVRPMLPKRVVTYNGVSVRASRFGDSVVPWHTRNIPGYESALVEGIRQYVETGDTVVVIGGGWGVSTVVAAKQSGSDGEVITFEGSAEAVSKVKDTIRLNGVSNRVSVHHAIVAEAVSLRGKSDNAKTIQPPDLPNCDVLVLDCEGAEVNIIREMKVCPHTVIAETHGMFDAPERIVRNELVNKGYTVIKSMVAEERLKIICEEKGIYVLHSIRDDRITDSSHNY